MRISLNTMCRIDILNEWLFGVVYTVQCEAIGIASLHCSIKYSIDIESCVAVQMFARAFFLFIDLIYCAR